MERNDTFLTIVRNNGNFPAVMAAGSNGETSYFDSAEEVYISERRTRIEVMNHGGAECDVVQCLKEVPADKYGLRDAQAVLKWLGY